MITSLRLGRFKRFSKLTLPLSNLTVLTGTNGAGKTSVIHSLLLAHQAASNPEQGYVALNDVDTLQLGDAADLIHRSSKGDTFSIEITEDENDYKWSFRVSPDERTLNAGVAQPEGGYAGALCKPSPGFGYLCAERFGPRDSLGVTSVEPAQVGTGIRGEFTAQVLATCDRERISQGRRAHADTKGRPGYLPYEVEAWMSLIVRPIEIDAHWLPGTSITTLRFKNPGVQSEWTRPPNMGFGISYALPIIVSGLRAPAGGVLIVENPEAHLHPAAQSRIGVFLARVAADGVQVLVETHSDHVLNGIRRAVAERRPEFPPSNVAIHFFQGEDSQEPDLSSPTINLAGQLSSWPKGFFDQAQRDLAELAKGPRRGT